MKKTYLLLLNEHGKKELSNTPVMRVLASKNGWLRCRSIDQNGPLLLAVVIPPEWSKLENDVELQIPYGFVSCISSAADKKTLGFLMNDKDSDKKSEVGHSQ
jgi:hypothetical protein